MKKSYYFATPGDSLKGPYSSLKAVRREILRQSKDCFDGACNCLKGNSNENWFELIQVFELVETLKPVVKGTFTLEVQP